MTEVLTIDCPELSSLSGNFISARSCKIYREFNDCPESCLQHPKFSRIVATMPRAVTSPSGAEASTPETNTGQPGEPKKKKGKGSSQKPARWCPDLEKQVYEVTCQRRHRRAYCQKPCEYKTELDEKMKARQLYAEKLDREEVRPREAQTNPEPIHYTPGCVNYAKLCELLETEHSDVLAELLRRAKAELRDVEAQIVWELIMSLDLPIEEEKP